MVDPKSLKTLEDKYSKLCPGYTFDDIIYLKDFMNSPQLSSTIRACIQNTNKPAVALIRFIYLTFRGEFRKNIYRIVFEMQLEDMPLLIGGFSGDAFHYLNEIQSFVVWRLKIGK